MAKARACKLDWCDRPSHAKGWCHGHYRRNRLGTDMGKPFQAQMARGDGCSEQGCDRPHGAMGWCGMHYLRSLRAANMGKPVRAKNPGEWGAWFTRPNGYVNRVRKLDGRKEHQAQHRHIMEVHFGGPLEKHENVHHLNGVRDDNRIENLELWSTSQPSGQRIEDKTAWAIEWLRKYSPEALTSGDQSGNSRLELKAGQVPADR